MFKKELFSVCTFYAISPVHAGSGASTSAVDLPIQRERHTNWPHIQASGVKGAIRDHYRKFAGEKQGQTINFIFGSDRDNDKNQSGADGDLPGAISISDAKLFAFPMRSNIAPFVWVTCPAVLKRLKNDLEFAGFSSFDEPPPVSDDNAFGLCGIDIEKINKVVIEDAVVNIIPVPVEGFKLPEGFPETERLLLVSDEIFDYCVSSCTEIQTQIKINSETGIASSGALRYQELLPSDTVMYSVVYYSAASGMDALKSSVIQSHIEDVVSGFMQIGGDETLGRGICKISWISSKNC